MVLNCIRTRVKCLIYKQVKRNDAANGKSEKEITRMVIDRLQKKNNAKQKSKNKPIFTDRTQMENFLKLS